MQKQRRDRLRAIAAKAALAAPGSAQFPLARIGTKREARSLPFHHLTALPGVISERPRLR